MKILVLKETAAGETRVSATPETVKKLIASGATVTVEAGAGAHAGVVDSAYEEAGADVSSKPDLASFDLVMCVQRPLVETIKKMREGAALIGLLDPFAFDDIADAINAQKVTALAMEFTPRITRAQSMDALSSQSNLSGYRAVIEGASLYGRAMPMMMTAAGTVAPAKVFVMGAGVAGLQAIATARRLGAVVSATDVRPAAKEQVASLGAKFIAVEDDEFKAAETSGGYAKAMSDEYQAKQAELVASHIAKQDIVITTALIPGRPAPRLVTAKMLSTMGEGAVAIDMAVAQGGNVEGSVPDEVVKIGPVSVAGFTNLPARLATDASALYAKNLLAFLPLITGEENALNIDFEEEIVSAMVLTHQGKTVNERLL